MTSFPQAGVNLSFEMMTSGSDESWFLVLEERRIDLREGEVTLGRSRGCGVVLRDPSVSRGHALLSVRQGRVTLQDLRSSNGTYVNGKRLEKETVLENGDRLVIGETELFLHQTRVGEGKPEGKRIETGEASLFCPACGLPIHGSAGGRCPGCGAELSGSRLPRLSEAVGLGEVLPVGEVLGAPSGTWENTGYRPSAIFEAREETPVGPPTDRSSTAETRPRDASGPQDALSELPMSVREAEYRPPPPDVRSTVVDTRDQIPPSPAPGLWSRLSGYLRGRRGPEPPPT
jgi:hypothetical protein